MAWVLVGNIKGAHGLDGAPGAASQVPGKDGLGIKSAEIDENGILRVIRDDGALLLEKRVIGKDGAKGETGVGIVDAATDDEGRVLFTLSNGTILKTGSLRGEDGLGFDDMDAEQIDERTLRLTWQRGDRIKTFDLHFASPLYQEVYKSGVAYRKGDFVTWGGSLWIALKDTADQPETTDAWRLAVKKGRDGRDGKPGEKGEKGETGRPGKDLTQMGSDGSKW